MTRLLNKSPRNIDPSLALTLHPYSLPPSASDSQYKPAIKELEVGVTDHFVLNATHYMEGMEGYCWWSVKSAASKECGRGNGTCQKKRACVVRCAVRVFNTRRCGRVVVWLYGCGK